MGARLGLGVRSAPPGICFQAESQRVSGFGLVRRDGKAGVPARAQHVQRLRGWGTSEGGVHQRFAGAIGELGFRGTCSQARGSGRHPLSAHTLPALCRGCLSGAGAGGAPPAWWSRARGAPNGPWGPSSGEWSRPANVRSPRPQAAGAPAATPATIDTHQAAAAWRAPSPGASDGRSGASRAAGGAGWRRKGVPAGASVQSQPGFSPLLQARPHSPQSLSAPLLAPCPSPSRLSVSPSPPDQSVSPTPSLGLTGHAPPGGRLWTKQGPCNLRRPPGSPFLPPRPPSRWEPGVPGDAFGDQAKASQLGVNEALRGNTTGAPPNPQKSR